MPLQAARGLGSYSSAEPDRILMVCGRPFRSTVHYQHVTMPDSDSVQANQGTSLRALIDRIYHEFFGWRARRLGSGYQQVNSLRVATVEAYGRLSPDAQADVVADIVKCGEEITFRRRTFEIFDCSDTLHAYITDLVCEFVCHELMHDPEIFIENEKREALLEQA
jgi:hypothetical protein